MDEELICLMAIRDVNVPKFLLDDLQLFRGIVSDLFPNIKEEITDYGPLMTSICSTCPKLGVKEVEGTTLHQVRQILQTYKNRFLTVFYIE